MKKLSLTIGTLALAVAATLAMAGPGGPGHGHGYGHGSRMRRGRRAGRRYRRGMSGRLRSGHGSRMRHGRRTGRGRRCRRGCGMPGRQWSRCGSRLRAWRHARHARRRSGHGVADAGRTDAAPRVDAQPEVRRGVHGLHDAAPADAAGPREGKGRGSAAGTARQRVRTDEGARHVRLTSRPHERLAAVAPARSDARHRARCTNRRRGSLP